MAQYPKDPAVCAGCSGCDDTLAALDDAAWEAWVHEDRVDPLAQVIVPPTPVVRYVTTGPCFTHRVVGCPCVGPIARND